MVAVWLGENLGLEAPIKVLENIREMNLGFCHNVLFVADVPAAREFYIEKMGFSLLEDNPNIFAFRAGDVRFSVFGNNPPKTEDASITVMFRTDDIEKTVAELRARGVKIEQEIRDAPGFAKHVAFNDPHGNEIYVGQYYRDPLEPV